MIAGHPPVDGQRWRCPNCGSGPEEHGVDRDGPESLDVVVCRRCGATWLPRPVEPDTIAEPQ